MEKQKSFLGSYISSSFDSKHTFILLQEYKEKKNWSSLLSEATIHFFCFPDRILETQNQDICFEIKMYEENSEPSEQKPLNE